MGTPDDREVGRRDLTVAVHIAELEATGRFARLIPDAGISSRGGLGRCVERRDLRRAVEVPVRLVAIERPDRGADLVDDVVRQACGIGTEERDRKSTRLNSSHTVISYAVFCLKKKN